MNGFSVLVAIVSLFLASDTGMAAEYKCLQKPACPDWAICSKNCHLHKEIFSTWGRPTAIQSPVVPVLPPHHPVSLEEWTNILKNKAEEKGR